MTPLWLGVFTAVGTSDAHAIGGNVAPSTPASKPGTTVGGVRDSYVFVFSQDPDDVEAMNNAVKKDNPDLGNDTLQGSYVLSNDQFWGVTQESGVQYRKFSFDGSDTKDPKDNHMFAYTTSFYCANNKIVDDAPANGVYAKVEMSVLVHLDDGFWKTSADGVPGTHKAGALIKHFTSYKNAKAAPGTPSSSNVISDWGIDGIYKDGHWEDIANPANSYSGCFPPGMLRSSGFFMNIRNRNDPKVDDAKWAAAEDAVANQQDAQTDDSGGGGGKPEQCSALALGIGWAVCPIIELINNTLVWGFQQFILQSLHVDPLNQDSDWGGNLYPIWDNFRTLANSLLVVAFLVIIFANMITL